jgi:hypothetical protein
MTKIISVSVILLVLFVSTTAAQGTLYKGFQSINIIWQGKALKPTEGVPAIIVDNHTLVPVYMLKQSGWYTVKKGNSLEILDKRTPYIKSIEILHTYNRARIQSLDKVNNSISLILLQILEKDPQAAAAIGALEEELDSIRDSSNDRNLMNLRTGFTDRPDAIYQISLLTDHYLQALQYLKEYTNDNNSNKLDLFKNEYNSALTGLSVLKNEYNDLVNSSFVKVFSFNQ